MLRINRFFGIAGAVVFLFGVAGALLGLTPSGSVFNDLMLLSHIFLGIALMVYWFFACGLKNLEGSDRASKTRVARYGLNASLYIAVMLGIITVANYLAHKHNQRWDLTEQGVYSLSPQSRKTVEKLSLPLKIVAFKVVQDVQGLTDLLELYKGANSSKVTASVVDPRTKINLVEQYQMKPGNVIYLEYGEGENKGVSRLNETTEQAITNAIIKLTRGAAKKIYYVTGHEEPDIKSPQQNGFVKLADAISDEHLTVEPILLSTISKLPDDTASVILASPKKPLMTEERNMLVQYAQEGGRLILLTDPRTTDDVKIIANEFGIKVGDNVVIDQVQRLFSGPALGAQPVVQNYDASHPITSNFNSNNVTIYNIASTVTTDIKNSGNETYTELVKTSPTSWAETNIDALFDSSNPTAQKEDNDIKGPVSLALAYEKKFDDSAENKDASQDPKFDKTTRVVVFGDTDWILNSNFEVYANRDLILNAVNWTVGEEGGITIRPRAMRASVTEFTRDMFITMLRSSLFIPELILLFGLFIWWRRKEVTA